MVRCWRALSYNPLTALIDEVIKAQGLQLLVGAGWDSIERCWGSLRLDCWVYAELVFDTFPPSTVLYVPKDGQAGGRRMLIKILTHLNTEGLGARHM